MRKQFCAIVLTLILAAPTFAAKRDRMGCLVVHNDSPTIVRVHVLGAVNHKAEALRDVVAHGKMILALPVGDTPLIVDEETITWGTVESTGAFYVKRALKNNSAASYLPTRPSMEKCDWVWVEVFE